MPYSKRNTYRRRNMRRRPPPRRGRLQTARKMTGNEPTTIVDKIANGVGTVATVAKTVSMLASMINVEDKYVDTPIVLTPSPGTPTFALQLNQIAQGVDFNQRNGNKVLDKCLQINMRMFLDATATTLASNTMRIIILIDKKPQIGALTFNTVYSPANDPAALIDKNVGGDRIVVLKDMKFVFSGGERRLFYKKFYCNLARIHTQFTGPTATAFETGAIYMIGVTDVSGLQPPLYIRGNARFCYMDN